MTVLELEELIAERYYTIGKRYFSKKLPGEIIPAIQFDYVGNDKLILDKCTTLNYYFNFNKDSKVTETCIYGVSFDSKCFNTCMLLINYTSKIKKRAMCIFIDYLIILKLNRIIKLISVCRKMPSGKLSEDEYDKILDDKVFSDTMGKEYHNVAIEYLINSAETESEKSIINNIHIYYNVPSVRSKGSDNQNTNIDDYTLSVLSSSKFDAIKNPKKYKISDEGIRINKNTNMIKLTPNL